MKPWTYPNFDGLLDLAQRDGVDIRPIMLRVITDSYLLTAAHTPQDERQFTELALRLLDGVDVPARAAMAERLLTYPAVPKPIIARLARDDIEVAAPILEHSAALTPEDLAAIAKECSPAHSDIIAQRMSKAASEAATAAPACAASDGVSPSPEGAAADLALSEPASLALEQAPAPRAATVGAGDAEAVELCELFFAAGGLERRLILLHLDYAATEPAALATRLQRHDVWRIETASLRHETDAVARDIQRTLGVSSRQARRIVEDERGEPVVVAAKAMELPGDVVQRMLLFLNSEVGQSVDRVYELSSLYREISVDAARRLVALWRAAEPAESRPALQETPAWNRAAASGRRAPAEISRAPAQAPERRRDVISTR